MMKFSGMQKVALVVGVALVAGLVVLLLPSPLPVDIGVVGRSSLQVTLEGEGVSRVRERFVVSSPVNGKLERISLRAGDEISRGMIVARVTPPPLNRQESEEARSRSSSAEALLESARAAESRVMVDLEQARKQHERYKRLFSKGAVLAEVYEESVRQAETLERELRLRSFNVRSATFELRALQTLIGNMTGTESIEVFSPGEGVVLRVLQESERVVSAGTPLVEIGDTSMRELVIDLLSSEAVGVAPGMKVEVFHWGGEGVLNGTVRTVEPSAFTKVSALGIEEQRVNIVIDLHDREERLGDNYRVEARIVLWEDDEVLQVPVSALFRVDDEWNVFRLQDGRARRVPVRIGKRATYAAEVLDGLEAGDEVVLHPSNELEDGMRVVESIRDRQ